MTQFVSRFNEVIMPRRVMKLESSPGWVILESSILMDGYTLTGIRALCYRPLSMTSGSDDRSAEFYAVLGHITIKTEEHKSFLPPSSSWLVEGQDIKWSSSSQGSKIVSLKITWKWRDGDSPYFSYNVYVEEITKVKGTGPNRVMSVDAPKYLGAAQVRSFYVSDHVVPPSVASLKFIIQVCGVDGACQKLDESPSFALERWGSFCVYLTAYSFSISSLLREGRFNSFPSISAVWWLQIDCLRRLSNIRILSPCRTHFRAS